MQLDDVTIEVRDASLARIGILLPEDATFELYPVFCDVGQWKLTLPAEHPLALTLRTPGAGIIATGPTDIILSGPVTGAPFEATPEDPVGTVSFQGITDEHVLQDALSYPLPTTADVSAQTVAHDERTGPAESLLHAYVKANIGSLAPAARQVANFANGTNSARGSTQTKKPRFQQLLNLLQEIVAGEELGFRVVQRDDVLTFETYAVADLTATIRLSAENGTLAGQKVNLQAPTKTRIVVAGQGEQVDRKFREVTTTDSLAAESAWHRRIEFFKDERNTNDDGELDQAGLDELADGGSTVITVQAIPADDDNNMRLGQNWGLGDKVTVVVEDQELTSIVTGLAVVANQESGFKCGVIIGDPTGFNYNALVRKRLRSHDDRIGHLERNAEISATLPQTVADLQTAVDSNTTDITAAQGDISSLQSDVSDAQADISTIDARSQANENQLLSLPLKAAAGSTSIATSGQTGSATVLLPSGRFSAAPIVTATVNSTAPLTRNVGVTSVTSTQFTANVSISGGSGSSAVGIVWHAIQMTPTTGAG